MMLGTPFALAAFHVAWPCQAFLTTDGQRELPDSQVYNDGFPPVILGSQAGFTI